MVILVKAFKNNSFHFTNDDWVAGWNILVPSKNPIDNMRSGLIILQHKGIIRI